MGLQANVPQPYDDDEEGAENNTTADDIEAALTDLQVGLLYFIHFIMYEYKTGTPSFLLAILLIKFYF